ncbi:alternative splicing factor ASF-1, putative [Plasmodium ovale]|uniref:Alternative splicing factor ASF-1, putative n=2 Tax=Plasmodium ovale TaxID=36330 RepID=A0A1D3THU3_PLAOA|nr:alternative splicing factor ASF-1, putative [Plasmodium ovale]
MRKAVGGNRLYVGNIPGSATKQEIIKMFEEFGKITDIDIKYNRNSNGTNYAFIEYRNPKSAEKTIMKKNGKKYKGYILKVEYSIDKKNKESTHNSDFYYRSHHGVIVKNFPRMVRCKSVSEFLSKAGRVLYTHFENGVTFAEYEDKESVLKAVATLDRTLYNPHVQMYVRVIEDMPGEYAFRVPTVVDTGDEDGDGDGGGDERNRSDGSSICGDGVDNSCATIFGDGENGQPSSLQMHNTNVEERDSSFPPQNGTNDSNKSPMLQSMDDVSEEIDNSPADVSENKNTPCFKEKEELLT